MDFKIITDTGCDLDMELANEIGLSFVPFHISMDDKHYVDDENLDRDKFLEDMLQSKTGPKTACPSPNDYLNILEGCSEENLIVVTISSKLSGSYNSAHMAVRDFKDMCPEKNVYLVDSMSASAGQTALVLKIYDIMAEDKALEEKFKQIDLAVQSTRTYFILESFDNLIKNGRMTKLSGTISNLLHIRPIMTGKDGEISLFEINRGFKKSMNKLVDQIGKDLDSFEEKNLVISHVGAPERAEYMKERLEKLYDFDKILIQKAKALSSAYADRGGIVVGF